MAIKDLIVTKLTDLDYQTIDTALKSIEKVLLGKTVNLSPEERQQYGSINEKNKLFVDKIKLFLEQFPQMNSPKTDVKEFQNDYIARRSMEQVLVRLAALSEQVADTKTLHDHDNYQAALSQYAYYRYLAGENEPGVDSVVADLKQFFPRTPSDTTPETEN